MAAGAIAHFFNRATRTMVPSVRGSGRHASLSAVMPCLRPADPVFYTEWRDGRFALAGTSMVLAGRSPFAVEGAPDAWLRELHGFEWLRHIPPTVDEDAAAHVEALVSEWLAMRRRPALVAVLPRVVARRLLSWLAHADVLLQTDETDHYDDVLRALMADVAALQSTVKMTADTIDDYAGQLLGHIALVAAGLCLDDAPLLKTGQVALAAALADRTSGVCAAAWRVPPLLAEWLLELETLRRAYRMQRRDVPDFLTAAVARLKASVEGLLLGDGSLALLGTDRSAPNVKLAVWMAMRHADVKAGQAACHSGIGSVRLAADETCVIFDVGAPIAAKHALAIEMSSGSAAVLVHDGVASKSGAAESQLLVFTSPVSGGNVAAPAARRQPSLEPAHTVTTELAPGLPQRADATHAGQAQRGVAHRRRLVLSESGRTLEGIDELRPLVGASEPTALSFAVRFVLHPTVDVAFDRDRDALCLTAENGHRWAFSARGYTLSVEGCTYQNGAAIEETSQVLVLADAAANRTIAWRLERLVDAGGETDVSNVQEPTAVPDAADQVTRPGSLAEALAALAPAQSRAVC